jgi:hypothetical protein
LLTAAADAPLLAELQQWLAQRQAPGRVLDWPGRAPSGQPAPAAPVPPGQRSNTTHTNTANGAVTGDAAHALEEKAAKERAERAQQAAYWVCDQQKGGATMAPADLAAQAAMLFGVRADEVLSALANRSSGVQGAQGGVQATQGTGTGGVSGNGFRALSDDEALGRVEALRRSFPIEEDGGNPFEHIRV